MRKKDQNPMMFGNDRNKFSILDAPMSWRTIFDLANVIMVFIDNKQKVSLINLKGCEILGYSESKIVGKNWFDNFVPKEDRKRVKHVYDTIMKGKIEPYAQFDNYVLTRSGEKRLISWNNTYLSDSQGKILFTFSSGTDITDELFVENCKKKLLKLKKENNELKNKIKKIKT